MVNSCVAFGCNYEYNPIKKISLHSFPFKRPEILDLWVKAIRRQNWSPSRTSRLCGSHFLANDYVNKPGSTTKSLKPDAVPSVFAFPKHLLKKVTPRVTSSGRLLVQKIQKTDPEFDKERPIESIGLESMVQSTSAGQIEFKDCGTQTTDNLERRFSSLHREVRTLRQKVKRKNFKIKSLKDIIEEISNRGHNNESLDAVLKNYFGGLSLEFVLMQKDSHEKKHPSQRRYSDLMKQFAHTLYFYSPKAYAFVREHFTLPNGRTIRKWLGSTKCEPGILNEVLEFLKNETTKNSKLKHCALIIDGMSIRKQIIWDESTGKFTGNVNYGKIIDVDYEMPASEALFFQIVCYSTSFKCPIAYFLINKVDANLQAQLIRACLSSLNEVGITIHSITCDGSQANIATYCKLG